MPTLKSLASLSFLASLTLWTPLQSQENPRALMLQARAKQLKTGGNDPAGAVALYRKVIALEPRSAEAHLRLSEAMVESGDLDGALAPAIKATELNPRNAEAWVHLGLLQTQRSQFNTTLRTEACRAFQEASRLLPGDPEVWFRLAQLHQTLGNNEASLKAWLALGRIHPPTWISDRPLEEIAWENAALLAKSLNHYESMREAIMALGDQPNPTQKHLRMLEELAREQADKGFLGHAEDSFVLLGSHFPKEPAIWENISHIQMQTGRFEDALRSFRRAEALKPAARFFYFQGLCLMSLGRLQEAEGYWKRLITGEAPPEHNEEMRQNSRYFLCAIALMQGHSSEALSLIQAWPSSKDQPELAAVKTQGLIQLRSWKAARTSLMDGMCRFPDEPLFLAAKSTPRTLLQESMITKKDARQAMIQLDLEAMATLWARFHQWGKSLEMVQRARNVGPLRRIDLLMLESNALDQLGRPMDAIKTLREAQKLDMNYPMLQNNLGYLLLENDGDLKEASQLIQSAMAQDPTSGSTVDSWGWVLFKQGKFQEAEEALQKAVELTPYSPEIRKHLGEVLLKLNRPEEALEHWERALAYAFPQRKELEDKVQKLRTELAKQRSKNLPSSDSAASEAEEEIPDEDPQ